MRFIFGCLIAAFFTVSAFAQDSKSSYRTVEPNPVPYDKLDTWTMGFAYYPVRIAELDVPGKGKQIVWYMIFDVWNKSGSPQLIVPEFTIVSKDLTNPGSFTDEPSPSLLKQIVAIEDPKNLYNIKSSTAIMKDKIPVTKADSFPNFVRGVAIWTNAPSQAANMNKFSVYVSGISNGLVENETTEGSIVVRRKTLQIDFIKPTDNRNIKIDDIKVDDNNGLGSEKWYYRASTYKKKQN
jgi:hypothetical protein